MRAGGRRGSGWSGSAAWPAWPGESPRRAGRRTERKKEQATERRERATIGGEHEHDGRVFSAGGRTDRRPRAASCCSADCFGDTGTEDGLAHETREDREQEGEGQPDSPESNSREQIKGGRATAGNESQDTDRTDSARHHDGQETARRKRTRRTGDRRTKADTADGRPQDESGHGGTAGDSEILHTADHGRGGGG